MEINEDSMHTLVKCGMLVWGKFKISIGTSVDFYSKTAANIQGFHSLSIPILQEWIPVFLDSRIFVNFLFKKMSPWHCYASYHCQVL